MAAEVGRKLALAIQRAFDQQALQNERGKQDFDTANWNRKLAGLLEPEIHRLYLNSAKVARVAGTPEVKLVQQLVASAKADSVLLAQQLNDTTSRWLDEGRDPVSVFGADRAATIGLTQASDALNNVKLIVAKLVKHTRKRWHCTTSTCCPECRELNGRVIGINKQFVTKKGNTAQSPPMHPNCSCRLETLP